MEPMLFSAFAKPGSYHDTVLTPLALFIVCPKVPSIKHSLHLPDAGRGVRKERRGQTASTRTHPLPLVQGLLQIRAIDQDLSRALSSAARCGCGISCFMKTRSVHSSNSCISIEASRRLSRKEFLDVPGDAQESRRSKLLPAAFWQRCGVDPGQWPRRSIVRSQQTTNELYEVPPAFGADAALPRFFQNSRRVFRAQPPTCVPGSNTLAA
jgi:hypothetical protein